MPQVWSLCSECRTNLNKERGEKSNYAEKDEEVSLLMACHVKERTSNYMWYLDIGYSNHMYGDKSVFTGLDESFRDTITFGDDSTILSCEKEMLESVLKKIRVRVFPMFYLFLT